MGRTFWHLGDIGNGALVVVFMLRRGDDPGLGVHPPSTEPKSGESARGATEPTIPRWPSATKDGVDQFELLLRGSRRDVGDADSGEHLLERGGDTLGLEPLPVLLGLPHADVAQAPVALDDEMGDQALGLLVSDLNWRRSTRRLGTRPGW